MKQFYFFSCSVFLFISILFSACNLYNPAEPVPSYIRINKIDLVTTEEEGTNSHKITDAWVYVDEKLIGCFELPVTIPLLYEGDHQIAIKAGIKVNGISATRAPYPFYERFVQTTTLTRGSVSTINPVVTYVTNLNWEGDFLWEENFDAGTTLQNSPSGTDTAIKHFTIPLGATDPMVFEGTGSAVAYLDANRTFFECVSSDSYVLPRGDAPSFLELNYKCNYQFVVGLFAHGPAGTNKYKVINVNPSPEWNKIYIYLSPVVSSAGATTDFNVFIGMLNNTDASNAFIAIDNIKLLHY